MKKRLFTVLALNVALILSACTAPECSETYFLVDVTDHEHANFPNGDIVATYLALTTDPYAGSVVTLQAVADVSYTMAKQCRIEPGSPVLQGKLKRRRRMNLFWEELYAACENLRAIPYGRDRSSIYVAMANALEELSESTAQRRRLVLVSDLHENTEYYSVFREGDWNLMLKDPETVIDHLEDYMPLPPDLSGIVVEIRHTPRDAEQSDRFLVLTSVFRKMLEDRGAVVVVSGIW